MAWGTDTAATQLTTITTEQFFNVTPTASAQHVYWQVQIKVDFPATPTVATVKLYTTLDAATEVWDATGIMNFQIATSPDPNIVTIQFSCYRWRIGISTTGNALTTADLSYRELTAAA